MGELDFVIEHEGRVLPLEIKSGKDYKKHSALDNALKTEAYDISRAYVFTNDNVSCEGAITYYPIYMIMFLQENAMGFADISLEKFKC